MNWKLFVGKQLYRAEQRLLKINFRFISKHYPYGRDWMYDVKRILNNAQVIVDAGANIGALSAGLSYWFPGSDVYAFEPIQATFAALEKNVAGNPSIHPVKMGLGTVTGKLNILLNEEDTINSLKVTEAHAGIIGTEEIDLIRLDEFLQQRQLQQVDILKIDVEGFEFEVLQGCGAYLKNGISCIYIEVGYEREPAKVHFADVDSYMEAKGFQLCGIYETRRNLHDRRRLWYSNNLYIKKTLLAGSPV